MNENLGSRVARFARLLVDAASRVSQMLDGGPPPGRLQRGNDGSQRPLRSMSKKEKSPRTVVTNGCSD